MSKSAMMAAARRDHPGLGIPTEEERRAAREAGTLYSRYLVWKDALLAGAPRTGETGLDEFTKDPAFMDAASRAKREQSELQRSPGDPELLLEAVLRLEALARQYRRLGVPCPDAPPPFDGLPDVAALYEVRRVMED